MSSEDSESVISYENDCDCDPSVDSLGTETSNDSSETECSDIEETNHLSSCIGSLLVDDTSLDITFLVGGERIRAHRNIVASASPFFRALLYGGMRESSQVEIPMQDATPKEFKLLIGFIYTGTLKVTELEAESILKLIELAHLYGMETLQAGLSHRLARRLSVTNVLAIFRTARHLGLSSLLEKSSSFAEDNGKEVIQTEAFTKLSADEFEDLLSRCSRVHEIDKFIAVEEWCSNSSDDAEKTRILKTIQLSLIDKDDLLSIVKESGLIDAEQIRSAIQERKTKKQNVGTKRASKFRKPDFRVIREFAPINGPTYHGFMMGHSYDRDEENNLGYRISYGEPSLVNRITIHRSDTESRVFSYYIEVSASPFFDGWHRVVDRTNCASGSLQSHYFNPMRIQYFRIIGTRTPSDDAEDIILNFQPSYETESQDAAQL